MTASEKLVEQAVKNLGKKEVYTIVERIGKALDIGLDWIEGAVANKSNAEKIGKQIGEFLGSDKNIIREMTTKVKFGNIKKFAKRYV